MCEGEAFLIEGVCLDEDPLPELMLEDEAPLAEVIRAWRSPFSRGV